MKKYIVFISVLFVISIAGCIKNVQTSIEQWGVFQIDINGPSTGNPYLDIDLTAVFKNGDHIILVPGFYDGDGVYRIRFSPGIQGKWSYITQSNNIELSDKRGTFKCIPPSISNHGPVRTIDTFYLQYADGTPFYSVGTTAYQWTSVKQSIQERSLKTLAKGPFNKIRMCFFPIYFKYGNDSEPWKYPFKREGSKNDFSRPNFEFFQNFDKRIEQLLEMGIEADVILFHPYDICGYCEMGSEMNERYVRYMIARLSAYRNVWWSLANEWDVPKIKEAIDWESIGKLLQKEDPHQHLRGIHNWYSSEDHFYDHSKPWITHVSAQTSQFYNAIKWLKQYKKPLLFDEMRYEGDVSSSWGNLNGQEMTSYFWMAGLSGGYGTHGETFQNSADDSTEVRWWAKGGDLVGESPERIRFFRYVMEKAPLIEMTPYIPYNNDPKNLNTNIYILSKQGKYYLAYVAEADQTIEVNLAGDANYRMEIIDTWNMQIVEQTSVVPGIFKYITTSPYTLLKFYTN